MKAAVLDMSTTAAAECPLATARTPLGARPLISVVTPSYNQGRFIERCIQSVLAQDYAPFEHIVVDNCSTDQTLDVLRRYPHLTWVSEPDRGQSDALNKAIRRARGEIIAWINADDCYEPGAFALVARELRRGTGTLVLLGRIHVVDPDGRILNTTTPHFEDHEYLVDIWSHDHGLSQPGMFFRREVLQRVGLFDPRLHYAMDYDFWLRLTRHFPIRVIDAVLARFVVHPESKTGQARYFSGFGREAERVSRRYWGSPHTRRHWRLARACNRSAADALLREILNAHKSGHRVRWKLVAELLHRRPLALGNRHVLAVLGEQLGGLRVWGALRSLLGGRAPRRLPAAPVAPVTSGRVTVVIPTYNRAAWVTSAIESVLHQTAAQYCDIVVVDDGSTDDTRAALQTYAGRVRYLYQPNAGVSAARNTGLCVRPNEFVAFLDSDDQWHRTKIARQLDKLQRYPEAVFVACHGGRRAANGAEWSPALPDVPYGRPVDLAPFLFDGLFLLTSGVMVRAKHLPRGGPFCTSLKMCEDYLLWLRLACRGPAIVLDERLVTCGWDAPASLAADLRRVREAQIRSRYLARRELRRRPDCAAAWRAGLARMLAMHRDVAEREGARGLAARAAFRSLMVAPRGRGRWEWGRLLRTFLPQDWGQPPISHRSA